MARRVIVAIVWCVVFYFATCMIVGAVAGVVATASIEDGQDPAVVGGHAGHVAVQSSRLFIALGAVIVGAGGAYLQILPGTKA